MRAHHIKSKAYDEFLTDLRKSTLHTYYALSDLAENIRPNKHQAYTISRMTIGDLEDIQPYRLKGMSSLTRYVNEYRSKEAHISYDGNVTIYDWARNNFLLLPCVAWNGKTPDYTKGYSAPGLLRMWSSIYNRLDERSRALRGIPDNAEEKSITDEELQSKMQEYQDNLAEHMHGKRLNLIEKTRYDLDRRSIRVVDTNPADGLDDAIHGLLEACLGYLKARRGE